MMEPFCLGKPEENLSDDRILWLMGTPFRSAHIHGFVYLLLGLLSPNALASAPMANELQWAICEPSTKLVIEKLGAGISATKVYTSTYYDSEQLQLHNSGISLHVTAKDQPKGKKVVSKVKVRLQEMSAIDQGWMTQKGAKCEQDRYGQTTTTRCSIERTVKPEEDVVHESQNNLIKKAHPDFTMPPLKAWGPFAGARNVLTWPEVPGGVATLDETRLSDPSQVLIELSVRASAETAETVYQQVIDLLNQKQIVLCAKQVGRFERILDHGRVP